MNKILIIILVNLSVGAIAEEINFESKLLQKELAKNWDISFSELKEDSVLMDQFIGNGKFYSAYKNNQFIGSVYVGRVLSCRTGGCSIEPVLKTPENSEYFDVFILVSVNKNVDCARVFNYQATHGQEICSKGWLNQFKKSPKSEDFEVGSDIDSISGATISVYAVTHEINKVLAMLE